MGGASAVLHRRNVLAALCKHHPADHPKVIAARGELARAKVVAAINASGLDAHERAVLVSALDALAAPAAAHEATANAGAEA